MVKSVTVKLRKMYWVIHYFGHGFFMSLLMLNSYAYSEATEAQHNNKRILPSFHDTASVNRTVSLMTTNIEFSIVTSEVAAAETAIDQAISEMQRIEALMSEWREDSQISKINTFAGIKPIVVDQELFLLFQEALHISKLTEGKFDITFKGAGKLWDFRKGTQPTSKDLELAISAINYKHVTLNTDKKSIFLENRNTRVGLGGIAKGYAVDRAIQIIKNTGFDHFTVNAGGDLYAASTQAQKRWRVGIQNPRNRNELIAIIPVSNAAVATSGDYERYFEKKGERYHHILDPDTGYPAQLCQSVTIVAPRTYMADALATGVFVLGPEKGIALIEKLNNVEAVIVDQSGKVITSSSLTTLSTNE